MMGPRQVEQASLSYQFSLERHVPAGHLLRSIDRFVDLSALRRELAPFYSSTGRPSVDPELMLRMLLVGYCFGIRSERRLCDEVHLNLAYRWFCRLGLEGDVPDHSTFSKNRHDRFRDSDLLRRLFEPIPERPPSLWAYSFGTERGELVPCPLARQLTLELGEGQEDVQGKPSHAAGRAELLSDRREGDAVALECLN